MLDKSISGYWSGQVGWAESGRLVLQQSLSVKVFKLPHIKPQNEGLAMWKSSVSS